MSIIFAIGGGLDSTESDMGISLSQTCLVMLKNNISSNCPTYSEIMVLFPDSSNRYISGDFIKKDGIVQRDNPKYNNHYEAYRFSEPALWIDPPADVRDRIRMITIESQLPDYKILGVSSFMENNTQIIGHSRWVDSRCFNAVIDAEQWQILTGDSLNLLRNGCNENFTNYNHIQKIFHEYTKHDITTTYKWLFENWVKTAKALCRVLC